MGVDAPALAPLTVERHLALKRKMVSFEVIIATSNVHFHVFFFFFLVQKCVLVHLLLKSDDFF